MPKNILTLLNDIAETFIAKQMPQARLEAKWLLKAVLDIRESVFLENDYIVSDADLTRVTDAVTKRLSGLPLSKIIGKKGFWAFEFLTNENVLDPRPDTEILIEQVLKWVDSDKGRTYPYRILDLGTGSGCIILTLLSELPHAKAQALDISDKALETARQNADMLKISAPRIEFVKGSWLSPFETPNNDSCPCFDIIVSNPPYIPSKDIESLMIEVKEHDPILALDGGKDGFDAYEEIVKNLNLVIHPHTQIFFEIGTNQSDGISRIAANYGFAITNITKDLGGINRVVSMTLGAS